MALLQAAGVPAGVVQNAQDMLDRDPHMKARGYYRYLDHPETGRAAYDGPAASLSRNARLHPRRPRRCSANTPWTFASASSACAWTRSPTCWPKACWCRLVGRDVVLGAGGRGV